MLWPTDPRGMNKDDVKAVYNVSTNTAQELIYELKFNIIASGLDILPDLRQEDQITNVVRYWRDELYSSWMFLCLNLVSGR
jgi:hypothetical protein